MPSFELLAIIALAILAFGDLIVGVTNDAANFTNSAIGSKAGTRKTIMIIAAIGIIIGATFSDGIIEVARKGIFYPDFFSTKEAIMIFTSVAIADIILLDLYSTFGLPTSTTVSVVFELLGAAVLLAFWKMGSLKEAWEVINGASALRIILGIVLSVGIAFAVGLIVQFITRMIFTFEYKHILKKWGFLWSSVALTSLFFFILIKGGSHSILMTDEIKTVINENIYTLFLLLFAIFSALSFFLIKKGKNILKLIVLIGTGALAMAFAGNDLANFIGVSVAGFHSFFGAELGGTLPTPTWVLGLAGAIMAITLFKSKKAKTVSNTEINLASHEKHVMNHWNSNFFVEKLSKLVVFTFRILIFPIPDKLKKWVSNRMGKSNITCENENAFDLLRASVNLMVAAAIISFATSKKLPLSTTYVTFMVAMGTSLADGAWGKECAPHRVAGVLTVISGWFFTALLAFLMAGITVSILHFFKIYGLLLLIIGIALAMIKLMKVHNKYASRSISPKNKQV